MKKPQDITVRDRQSLNKKIVKLSEQVKKLKMIQAVQGVELKRQKKEQDRQDTVLRSVVEALQEGDYR